MNLWLISDTHWGHEKMYRIPFKRTDGTPLRPFPNAVEADNFMIEKWNEVVKPSDHIYHLGDVVIDRRYLGILAKLNGHKRLVRGNHDVYKTRFYLDAGFDEIYGVRILDDVIMSHIPIHKSCLNARWKGNIHGHLHSNTLDSTKYLNISVEHTKYAPISFEDAKKQLKEAQSEQTNLAHPL